MFNNDLSAANLYGVHRCIDCELLLKWMWKEVVFVQCKVLSQYLFGWIQEVHESSSRTDDHRASLVSWGGMSPLGTAVTNGLLYQPRMIDDGDCGAIGGMRIDRVSRSTRRKHASVPLCPP
jgi:hypothetical protein